MGSSHSQTYVDEQVTATAGDESSSRWRKEDSNLFSNSVPVHAKQILWVRTRIKRTSEALTIVVASKKEVMLMTGGKWG
jgi:hypothetical protein